MGAVAAEPAAAVHAGDPGAEVSEEGSRRGVCTGNCVGHCQPFGRWWPTQKILQLKFFFVVVHSAGGKIKRKNKLKI